MLLHRGSDFGVRNGALHEGAALASEFAAEFDEDEFALVFGLSESICETRVPVQSALIVEVGMSCPCGHTWIRIEPRLYGSKDAARHCARSGSMKSRIGLSFCFISMSSPAESKSVRITFVAAAALGLLFCGCGASDPSPQTPDTERSTSALAELPHVLLITVDTLRADRLGCYGYGRDTSPRIDDFAENAVRFEHAFAVAGTTLPSHLSIMTSLWPHQHGYVANKGAIKGPFKSGEGRNTAAEFFGQAGYETAAYVSGTTVKRTTGIQAGFTTFDQPETINRLGALTVDEALKWLDLFSEFGTKKNGDPRRFFMWIHLWDPHEPNTPPAPYDSMFERDGVVEKTLARHKIDLEALRNGFSDFEKARMFFPELVEPLKRGGDVVLPELTLDHLTQLHDLYDGDVRYTDDQIGRVLDCLDQKGFTGNTIVALTSDHGQALGQHDWLEHGRIQIENIHVPMIVRFPGSTIEQPRVVENVVSSVDLMPTLVARIDAPMRTKFLQQASGSDALSPEFDRPFAFSHRSERDRDNWESGRKFGLTFDGWKYYHLEEGDDQLYELTTDPDELINVAADHEGRVAKLERIVKTILATRPAGDSATGTVTPEDAAAMEAELKSLGYMGDE
ncbi:MAG: arylsulfatase A-like enzyme [Planctomycetota bacterium]